MKNTSGRVERVVSPSVCVAARQGATAAVLSGILVSPSAYVDSGNRSAVHGATQGEAAAILAQGSIS